MHTQFLACVVALSTAACGLIQIRQPGSVAEGATSFSGKECDKSSWKTDSTEDDVLRRICSDAPLYSAVVEAAMAVEQRHKKFDDRHPNYIASAMNVIDCAKNCEAFPLAMGVSAYYARTLDSGKLTKQLDGVQLSDDAKRVFVNAAIAAKAEVLAAADQLDPRRKHMYVDTVSDVVKQRDAYYAEHAELYTKLDAAEAEAVKARAEKKAPNQLVADLRALRDAYFSKCSSDTCRFGPFVIELTRELVLLYIAADDRLGARAENELLAEKAAGRHLFSVETGTALYRAMTEERHAYDAYEQAKESGVDAVTLEARFGKPPPVKVDPSTDYIGSENLPDLTAALGDSDEKNASLTVGIVATVVDSKTAGKDGEPLAKVTFRPNISKEEITNCFETGHVTGVRFDGNRAELEYESVCSVVGTKTNVEKIAPVSVPLAEVQAVRPGEELQALVDATQTGLVVRVVLGSQKQTKMLQVRGSRLPKP